MTIQISVVIWTIISFCVLAAILDRFLFKPVLKIMDDRNRKLEEDAAAKKAELDRREKIKTDARIQRDAMQKKAMEENERAMEQAQADAAKRIAERKADYDVREQALIEALQKESDELEKKFSGGIDELALDYATTIIR